METAVFVALAGAVVAGALPLAARGGTLAPGFVAIGTFAFGEGRKNAAAVGVEAELQHFVAVAVVEEDLSGGALAFEIFEIVRGEPAGFGHVGGSFGQGKAKALALLLVAELVEAPIAAEFGFGAAVLDGAEEPAVRRLEDFGDGLGGSLLFLRGFEAGGAGHGVGGDLTAVEERAGVAEVDGFGEDSLRNLGDEDLDGVEIFEEREGDFGTAGKDEVAAVAMTDAEIFAVDGGGPAHASGDGEGAAADGGRPQDGFVGESLRSGGHWWFLLKTVVSC